MHDFYFQQLDPLKDKIFWSPFWSTLLAALPVLVLFCCWCPGVCWRPRSVLPAP